MYGYGELDVKKEADLVSFPFHFSKILDKQSSTEAPRDGVKTAALVERIQSCRMADSDDSKLHDPSMGEKLPEMMLSMPSSPSSTRISKLVIPTITTQQSSLDSENTLGRLITNSKPDLKLSIQKPNMSPSLASTQGGGVDSNRVPAIIGLEEGRHDKKESFSVPSSLKLRRENDTHNEKIQKAHESNTNNVISPISVGASTSPTPLLKNDTNTHRVQKNDKKYFPSPRSPLVEKNRDGVLGVFGEEKDSEGHSTGSDVKKKNLPKQTHIFQQLPHLRERTPSPKRLSRTRRQRAPDRARKLFRNAEEAIRKQDKARFKMLKKKEMEKKEKILNQIPKSALEEKLDADIDLYATRHHMGGSVLDKYLFDLARRERRAIREVSGIKPLKRHRRNRSAGFKLKI
eukprot:jgi/Bigna1/66637/fgenesh1_pg.2_\